MFNSSSSSSQAAGSLGRLPRQWCPQPGQQSCSGLGVAKYHLSMVNTSLSIRDVFPSHLIKYTSPTVSLHSGLFSLIEVTTYEPAVALWVCCLSSRRTGTQSGFAHRGAIPHTPANARPREMLRAYLLNGGQQRHARALAISHNSFSHPNPGPQKDGAVANDTHFATCCEQTRGSS